MKVLLALLVCLLAGCSGFYAPQVNPSPAPQVSATQVVTEYVATYSLTVRSGPSVQHRALDWIDSGTRVTVLSKLNGWCRIERGWVNCKYLEKTK